ncbi:uncharacterized protein B0H18DRAFT_1007240 [Fomitopsis serialis]|uniref:uncharacterized protein n=1 Tax=Fomitopsis serialis TaxID=139415 RepID=UPI0020088B7A|nr:uncharacterized protein B0H18DRAFT_1007240 [Neoantrodia serialis]KAH9925980.1 hypothetical protein B0H18DRAFT_1007240 [Neoantrodia serialis]
MDVDALSATQKEALAQLQAIMDGGDADVAIGVLESVDWDVQRAANLIFENGIPPTKPRSPSPVSHIEEFDIDDSSQGLLGNNSRGGREFRRVHPSSSGALSARPLRAILAVLTLPLRLLTSVLRFIFRILRIPFPQFVPFTWSSLQYRPLGPGSGGDGRALDPRAQAERWVRALEEETGAVCVGRAGARRAEAKAGSVASGADVAGPSSLTSRAGAYEEDGGEGVTKFLPDFFLGSYEEFVRTCERGAKIGCVVLVSEEHDDVPEFKRGTLTDPTLIKLIQDNDILVWGGDIRDREAWSAAQKLQATTYPSVAFIALQQRRLGGSGSSSAPVLTVLSRQQGPSVPSTSAPTAAQSLVTHLTEQLLPRVTPFLAKIRAQAAERERERQLRAEQDRAFEESRQKDKERIEQRQSEERRAQQEQRRQIEAEARARDEARAKEEARHAWEAHRMEWRKYLRRGLVMREPRPGETGRGKTMRIGLRMPDGRRSVRFFGEGDTLTALYAYVDSMFVPKEVPDKGDPLGPPENGEPGEAGLVKEIERSGRAPEKWWAFKLWLAYPRKEVVWEPARRLGDVEALRGGGQLVVELGAGAESAKAKGKQRASDVLAGGEDDDGYETEE